MSDRELGIYLNDHLTGSTGGLALAKRAAKNADDEDRAEMWRSVAEEIAEERRILNQIRDRIGASPNVFKYAVAWAGEKAGRLKLNGYLLRQSDLGQLLELEGLVIGVTGKLALWNALDRLDDPRLSEFDFIGLAEQAVSQKSRLEQHRIRLVPRAIGNGSNGNADFERELEDEYPDDMTKPPWHDLEERLERENEAERPLRESGEGESEGFEEAEAELIHQAEDPELGRDPELDAFDSEEDAGSVYSEADELHSAEDPDSDYD